MYLIAVGVDDYRNPSMQLTYAAHDAAVFAGMLKSGRVQIQSFAAQLARELEVTRNLGTKSTWDLGYDTRRVIRFQSSAGEAHVQVLTDARAAKASVLEAIRSTVAQVQPEDTFVLFFAGHGVASGSHYYLLPSDLGYTGDLQRLAEDGRAAIEGRGISDADLEQALLPLDAAASAVIIDACESAHLLATGSDWRRGPIDSSGLAQVAYEKNQYLLAAAQSYQSAKETNTFGHGLLTYALAEEGIGQGKATAGEVGADGIPLKSVLQYAATRVPELDVSASTARGTRRTQGPDVSVRQQPSLTLRHVDETVPALLAARSVSLDPLTLVEPSPPTQSLDVRAPREFLRYPPATPGSIGAAAVVPDGGWVLTVDNFSREVWMWRLPDLVPLKTVAAARGANAIALSPDGRNLAVTTGGPDVVVVDLTSGQRRALPSLVKSGGETLEWMPDPRQILVTSRDIALIVDAVSGAVAQRFAHQSATRAYAFDDGRSIATLRTFDGDVVVWDAASGKQQRTVHLGSPIQYSAMSPKTPILALAGPKTITVCDLASGESRRLPAPDADVFGVGFSEDGGTLLVGLHGGRVVSYSVATNQPGPTRTSSAAYIGGVAPYSKGLIGYGLDDILVSWTGSTPTPAAELVRRGRMTNVATTATDVTIGGSDRESVLMHRLGDATSRALPHKDTTFFYTGGRYAATAAGKTLHLWDLAQLAPAGTIAGDHEWEAIDVTADGMRVFSCARVSNARVEIAEWQVQTGRKRRISVDDAPPSVPGCGQVWVSPGGEWVARAYGMAVFLYDSAKAGRAVDLSVDAAELQPITDVAFSPDGKAMAVAKGIGVYVYALPDGTLRRHIVPPQRDLISAMALTSDAHWLVAGDLAGGLSLSDVTADGTKGLEPLSGEIRSVQFWPEHGVFVALSGSGELHVIRGDTGALEAKGVWRAGTAEWILTAPDGTYDASPGMRGLVFRQNADGGIEPAGDAAQTSLKAGLWRDILQRLTPLR